MSLLWKPFSKSMRVLNRLNSNKRDKEDPLNQDMIRSLASNHEQVQQRIFTKWINMQLEGSGIKITSVEKDLRDGHALHALLKQLTNFPIQDIDKKNTRFHQLSNVSICLEFLENNLGELSNIGSIDIVDGNLKLTLGLLWLIILRFQIQKVISFEDVSIPNSPLSTEGSPGIQSLHSSDSLAPYNRTGSSTNIISKNTGKAGDPKKFLLEWVQGQLRRYEGLIPQVRDFNCSWQSGLAFAGLIHRHDSTLVPNLGDMVERVSRDRDEWRDVLDTSFRIAKEGMGIASLLEPDDILSATIPDEKIIMMYVSEFYKVMSAKQAREDYQEQLQLEGLVNQFMQLSASVSTQIEKFYTAFDNASFDYFTASPNQLEEFSHIQRQRSKSLNDYEPTVETLNKSASSILSSETSLDPELKASVTQSRDQILSRWSGLQEILAESERKLDEIQNWGELNHRITQLNEQLKDLGSLCSDFLELKNSLSEKERCERLEALKAATLEGADQLKELKEIAGSTAPPHIHQRLKRCGELIDIAQLNIQRFHVSLQVDDFTTYLADALHKLSHKRAELRKLIKASTWAPESQSYEEIEEQRVGQLQWKDAEGEVLVAEVKAKCTAIRQTIGDAPFEQSAQLELVLRKENEIMVSWKEIERILSVQELLMQQFASVERLAAKIKTAKQGVDQLQKESDAQDFGENFEARADQCLDNIEALHEERQQLPFPQLPETMGSDDFIANHISNHLDILTQRLMTLRSGRETHQEEDQLFELFSRVQMEGDELAASADQHMAWIEGNLGLLAKVTHPDAPTLFDQISAKKEELEAQNVRLEEQRQAFSQRIESLLPQIKPKSQIDQLQTIQSQMDARRESIESLTFKLMEILGVGQHMLSRIAFSLSLQSNISALRKELSSCRPAHTTQDALLAWSRRLEELDNTRSVPFPTCNTVAFSHITQLNDYLTACIRSTDSAIAKATQELASLETQVQNQPFEQFLKQADDFISSSKSLINITKKTLTTYQLKSTDGSQVMTAKSSALSMFVTSLQEKSAALQADHVLLNDQFESLKEKSNSCHSASVSKKTELDSAWKEFSATIDSVPIIHQQVQELTTRFSQLHQVDSTIQQTRSDIIDLLNANVEDMDSQINLLKEMLSKISLLLGRVAVYESPELSPQTPSDIAQVHIINRQALKELIRQIDASLSATQLLFTTNCEKAQKHQTQAVNCSQWEAWCRQQGELLEDEQRLMRSTLWKDASTSGLELLSKAKGTRIQLHDKLAQNQAQFEATIEPLDSTAENSARTAFKDLSSAITFQLAAIPKAMALSSHWALVQQAQRSISHHKGLLNRKPLNSNDLDAIRSAIEDDSSELSQAYIAYNASVSDFTELNQSLDDNIFLFVDPLRLEELVQASLAIPVNWEQLKRLANEMRDLLQASDMCRIIHERIELLHDKVNAIKVTGQSKKATELAQTQLSEIDYELKDKVLAQIRQWQNLVFSLPRDNANWSGKVKLTGEMIDLVTRAIDEKQHRLSTHQDQVQLLALCDEIDQKVGNYLATIDAITKDVEKSSTFLADLEKAATRLTEARDAVTTFINDGLDKVVEGASCIGDWQLEERAQVLPAQWDEVRQMGVELQAKLDKRIGLKQDAVQAQSLKKVQRAKLRAPLKYIPPNKDTVKSRYMTGVAEKKEKNDSQPPKGKPSPNVYVADMKDALDVEVARVVNSYPQVVKVIRDNETGKYWIGEKDPKLCFCRVLRSNLVMVRIGGGWSELSKYIADHAVDNPDYRSMSRSQSRTPSRAGSSLGTIYERNNFKSPSPSFGRRTMSPVSFSPRPGGRVLSPLSGLHDSSRLSGTMASMSNFGEVHSRSATPSLPSDPSFARHTVSSLSKSRPISRCESPSAQGASSPNSITMSPKSLSSPLAPRSPLTSAKKLSSTISKASTSTSKKPLP
ncbi:hypothetical protein DSO57_1021019 [Entomophthora muscae]|uniref:Uncharacterized protein n=1 Tax=Entomophthora muscae TaxID=34485 RepID=A0ACC2RUI7_9FUNG|nr:hypothetical protein DSO57_1021019 [Entomophthora muscae]